MSIKEIEIKKKFKVHLKIVEVFRIIKGKDIILLLELIRSFKESFRMIRNLEIIRNKKLKDSIEVIKIILISILYPKTSPVKLKDL